MTLEFSRSAPFTMGVELELMILSTHDWNLIRGAADLLALIEKEKACRRYQAGNHRKHDRDQHRGAHGLPRPCCPS